MVYTCVIIWTVDIMLAFSLADFLTASETISRIPRWALTSCPMIVNRTGRKLNTWPVGNTWVETVTIPASLANGTIIVGFTEEGFRFN